MSKALLCSKCGKKIPSDSLFCPNCGKQIEIKKDLISCVEKYIELRDESDFSKIYDLSYSKMYGLIYSRTKNREITEDVLQNAYIQCYKSIDQLSSPDSFQGWLSTICIREFFHYVKKQNNEVLLDDIKDEEGNAFDYFDSQADDTFDMPEKAAEDKVLKKLLMKNIDALPVNQRAVVISYYYDAKSVKEIAASMNVPENTVKTYLNRARKN